VIEDVFGFDIPMDDIAIMHELNGMANLLYHTLYLLFRKSSLAPQVVVDVASATELEDQVEVLLVREEGVELHDVWVVQVALDFDFAD
jgi:hypothetical protein